MLVDYLLRRGRVHTEDARFSILDLATNMLPELAEGRQVRAILRQAVLDAGATYIGKARCRNDSGTATQKDHVFSVPLLELRGFAERLAPSLDAIAQGTATPATPMRYGPAKRLQPRPPSQHALTQAQLVLAVQALQERVAALEIRVDK